MILRDWLSRALVRAGINPDVFRRALERAIVPEDVLSILRDVANFAYRSDVEYFLLNVFLFSFMFSIIISMFGFSSLSMNHRKHSVGMNFIKKKSCVFLFFSVKALDCPTWILPVLQGAGLDRSDFIAILKRNGNDMASACQWLFDFIRPADSSSTHVSFHFSYL